MTSTSVPVSSCLAKHELPEEEHPEALCPGDAKEELSATTGDSATVEPSVQPTPSATMQPSVPPSEPESTPSATMQPAVPPSVPEPTPSDTMQPSVHPSMHEEVADWGGGNRQRRSRVDHKPP